MLFILSIFVIIVTLVYSPWPLVKDPLRSNYYMSLTNPVICMKMYYRFPTGPALLYSTFSYSRYSNFSENQIEHKYATYIFKKINNKCENSVIFTTLGDDFQILKIRITINLSYKIGNLALFDYKFYKGFNFGFYTLIDCDKNFAIPVNVINKSQDYLWTGVSLKHNTESYEKSIPIKNDQICVITKNNYAVVLNLSYESYSPSGFIYGLQALIFHSGIYYGEVNYVAYACKKDIKYPDKPNVFLIDGKDLSIKINVLYRKYFTDTKELAMEFKLSNPKFINVQNLQLVPLSYKKVFLIKYRADFKYCPDGSWIYLYLSDNKTKYYVDAKKIIKISGNVEFIRKINRYLGDPCEELKKRIEDDIYKLI